MAKLQDQKDPIRKEGRKKGTTTQKMVTFRCDLENVEYLERQPNKGRYLNNLIRFDREAVKLGGADLDD